MKMTFIGLSLILLSACGKESSNSSYDDYGAYAPGSSLEEKSKNMNLSYDTPQSLGTLLSLRSNDPYSTEISACTWFLVEPDIAMTNSHCIPDHLKQSSQDCSEYMMGSFKNNLGENVHRKCKKIITVSKIQDDKILTNQDFAVIKLDAPVINVYPFEISRAGVKIDEQLTIHTMNHELNDSEVINSDYLEHECIVKSSDLFGTIDSPAVSTFMAFREENSYKRCKSVSGNSGSPVVNSDGKVVGVLYAGFNKDSSNEELSQSTQAQFDMTRDLALITNLSCANLVYNKDANFSKRCKHTNTNQDLKRQNLEKKIKESLEREMLTVYSYLPSSLEYEMKENRFGSRTVLSFTPKCVKPINAWSQNNLNMIEERGILNKSKYLTTHLSDYELSTNMKIDYYGNLNVTFSSRAMGVRYIHLNNLDSMENGSVKMVTEMDILDKKIKFESELKVCSDSKSEIK